MPNQRLTLEAIRKDGRLDTLVNAFATKEEAHELLDEIAFPRGQRPGFDKPKFFWREVCRVLEAGLVKGGIKALLTAAATLREDCAALAGAPIKVLFLAATPVNADVVQYGKEWEAIKALADSPRPVPFQAVPRFGIDDRQFLSVLTAEQPTVLHFSGHGLEKGQLVLQDDRDQPIYLSLQAVAAALKAVCATSPVRLVVLNACYAADAAEALWPDVEAVVGSEKALRDQLAQVFAKSFYETLTSTGQSLRSAVEAGRWSMRQHLERTPDLEDRFRSVVARARSRPGAAPAPADWVSEQVVVKTRPGIDPANWYLQGR
jgi:hypothetical protein